MPKENLEFGGFVTSELSVEEAPRCGSSLRLLGLYAMKGQGGGGSLSIEELVSVLKIDSACPVLLPYTVLHTDSAKTYRRVGPLRWPKPGALHAQFETAEPFLRHKYAHTNVTHKKKIGQPMQFVAQRLARFANGTVKNLSGGTLQVDGSWASLRRTIGKKSVNTGK
jgi:hypothetical protein